MTASVIISVAATIIATLSTIISVVRTHRTDNNRDGREIGQIMTELGYIKSSLDRIGITVDRQDERHRELLNTIGEMNTRITVLESCQNTNNVTFDIINKKIEHLDNQIVIINNNIAEIKSDIVKAEATNEK